MLRHGMDMECHRDIVWTYANFYVLVCVIFETSLQLSREKNICLTLPIEYIESFWICVDNIANFYFLLN